MEAVTSRKTRAMRAGGRPDLRGGPRKTIEKKRKARHSSIAPMHESKNFWMPEEDEDMLPVYVDQKPEIVKEVVNEAARSSNDGAASNETKKSSRFSLGAMFSTPAKQQPRKDSEASSIAQTPYKSFFSPFLSAIQHMTSKRSSFYLEGLEEPKMDTKEHSTSESVESIHSGAMDLSVTMKSHISKRDSYKKESESRHEAASHEPRACESDLSTSENPSHTSRQGAHRSRDDIIAEITNSMKVNDLRAELKAAGLQTKGKKQELVEIYVNAGLHEKGKNNVISRHREAIEQRTIYEAAEQLRRTADEQQVKSTQRGGAPDRLRRQREAEQKLRMEEEERIRKAAELHSRRQAEEMERARRQAEEMERARRQAEEMERARKHAEEMERARKHAEEMERARKHAEEMERARKHAEEMERARKQAEEMERARKQAEEMERARKQAEEMERARKQAEEMERARKQAEETESRKKAEQIERQRVEELERIREAERNNLRAERGRVERSRKQAADRRNQETRREQEKKRLRRETDQLQAFIEEDQAKLQALIDEESHLERTTPRKTPRKSGDNLVEALKRQSEGQRLEAMEDAGAADKSNGTAQRLSDSLRKTPQRRQQEAIEAHKLRLQDAKSRSQKAEEVVNRKPAAATRARRGLTSSQATLPVTTARRESKSSGSSSSFTQLAKKEEELQKQLHALQNLQSELGENPASNAVPSSITPRASRSSRQASRTKDRASGVKPTIEKKSRTVPARQSSKNADAGTGGRVTRSRARA